MFFLFFLKENKTTYFRLRSRQINPSKLYLKSFEFVGRFACILKCYFQDVDDDDDDDDVALKKPAASAAAHNILIKRKFNKSL